jgi:small conductance mechanosensitive channel
MLDRIAELYWGKLTPLALALFRVLVIIAVAIASTVLLRRAIHGIWLYVVQSLRKKADQSDIEIEKQATTIAGVLRKTTTVLIVALALAMSLRELGFDIAPLIAGVGVAGLAIGFGAQNLVRDVIAGFFMLIENQIRVNDVVVINDTPGVVEEMNLRTTVLRDAEGTVHVFPNGAISKLANRTQGFSFYLFSLFLSYKDDTDQALTILRETAAAVSAEEPFRAYILAPLEIFGVDQLGETHVIVKARIKTQPGRQWDVGREVNRRLKAKLDTAGFELPARGPRRIEIVTPGGGSMTREELKVILREVVEEMNADGQQSSRS